MIQSLLQPVIDSSRDRPLSDPSLLTTLGEQILADKQRSQAFGITPGTVQQAVQDRIQLLIASQSALTELLAQNKLSFLQTLDTLWDLWLPLAFHLARQRQRLDRPFIQGILGGQGTGKTTLGSVLTLLLHKLGYTAFSLSLDDLYKTHIDRLQLRTTDPRLVWRGPPGTHDVELGIQVLDRLRHPDGQPILMPQFDKSLHEGSGDRIEPKRVQNIDILLFEGWFVGARLIDPIQFETAPAPIQTEADRAFAQDMNLRLQDYLPLWERLDSLIVLAPSNYRFSKLWRKQAEQQMRSRGKAGMSDAEIESFVDYFWTALHPELFITPLITQSGYADLVIKIDQQHQPIAVYKPASNT